MVDLDRLLSFVEQTRIESAAWRYMIGDDEDASRPSFDDSGWRVLPASPNYRYFRQQTFAVIWFRTKFTIPQALSGDEVWLYFSGEGRAKAFLNGEPTAELHFGESPRGLILEEGEPLKEIVLALRMEEATVAPPVEGMSGILSLDTPRRRELADFARQLRFADILVKAGRAPAAPLERFLQEIPSESLDDAPKLLESLRKSAALLAPFEPALKEYTIHVVPHSHIDLAWGWTLEETRRRCQRIFSSVVEWLERDPSATFAQDQAAPYLFFEGTPLFERIRECIKAGRWDPIGGNYSQGDGILPSGEAMVRQFLYGKRFFKDEFGVDVKVAWGLDYFGGHPWALPQILRKCGLDAYVFSRGAGRDLCEFWWDSPDGSRVLGYHLISGYSVGLRVYERHVSRLFADWLPISLNRDLLLTSGTDFNIPDEVTIRNMEHLGRLALYPRARLSTAHEFFRHLREDAPYPVVRYELDPESAASPAPWTGCYTTRGRMKDRYRKLEAGLASTEALASIAALAGLPRSQVDLKKTWLDLLLVQSHDTLPGTSIDDVYEETYRICDRAEAELDSVRSKALGKIASKVDTSGDGTPVLVFNPLSWSRGGLVELDFYLPRSQASEISVVDEEGRAVPSQTQRLPAPPHMFSFRWKITLQAADVPAMGYRLYRVVPKQRPESARSSLRVSTGELENEYLKVSIDSDTGVLRSVFDKSAKRQALDPSRGGNLIQALKDAGTSMPAWTTQLTGEVEDILQLESLRVLEEGPVRGVLELRRRFRNSLVTQQVILEAGCRWVTLVTDIDCHDGNYVFKAGFAVSGRHGFPVCETQFGAIPRRNPSAPAEAVAPWKLPPGRQPGILAMERMGEWAAQRWADLSTSEHGAAILNRNRYAYDLVAGNFLRLTLLRNIFHGGTQESDGGLSRIEYAFYPHAGDWRAGDVTRAASEFNHPLIPFVDIPHRGDLPPRHGFLEVVPGNIFLSAFKPAEDSPALVVRLYEGHGEETEAALRFDRTVARASEVDMIEWREIAELPAAGASLKLRFAPFEVKTVRLELGPPATSAGTPARAAPKPRGKRPTPPSMHS